MIGAETDDALYRFGVEPAPWEPDEDATATINYTSGTTARPKGVQLTHRNLWLNATTFGWQAGVSDRDVYLHTLPMFHCNGWGMPYAVTGMGGRHVVLRKVDGAEILRRVERHGVTLLCGAPAVVAMILDAAADVGRADPGRGTVRIVVAGAPPPTRTIERVETELGWEFIQIYGLTETSPLLTMNRRRAEWDDLTPASGPGELGRAGAPALGVQIASTTRARCWPGATSSWTATGSSRRRPPRRSSTAGSTPATAAYIDDERLPDDLRPQEGRDHLRRRERRRRSRSRTRCSRTRPWPRSRSSACPTRSGARR